MNWRFAVPTERLESIDADWMNLNWIMQTMLPERVLLGLTNFVSLVFFCPMNHVYSRRSFCGRVENLSRAKPLIRKHSRMDGTSF
jgi:hypothetical protein